LQPDQFIDEGEVGVSGAADQEEELGDAAGGVNGATSGGGVSSSSWLWMKLSEEDRGGILANRPILVISG
jgi:hypothetical protein